MYYRRIESSPAIAAKHNANQKAAAKARLIDVARKVKAKKAARKEG